jgi:hypothetical protein
MEADPVADSVADAKKSDKSKEDADKQEADPVADAAADAKKSDKSKKDGELTAVPAADDKKDVNPADEKNANLRGADNNKASETAKR